MLYDVIILGGGPAGAAGVVYAARKRLKTLLITAEWGGQSVVSEQIYNWIGTPSLSGNDLAANFKKHVEEYKGEFLDIEEGQKVTGLAKTESGFSVTTDAGKAFVGKTILVSTGSGRRKLEAKGADVFENRGVTYCASCDGPLFADMDVAVIGGGNAGFETAAQLLAYCKSVTLLHRSPEFKADAITVEKVLANSKMKAVKNVDILEVTGADFVTGITYKDKNGGEPVTLPVSGIFVEVGQLPNTDFAAGILALDANKKIVVDPMTQRTSVAGIWAAGDATNGKYHQNNIAAGDAVKALEDLYLYLHAQ